MSNWTSGSGVPSHLLADGLVRLHPVARVAFLLAMQRSSLAAWRRATMTVCGFVLVAASGLVLSLWSAASIRQDIAHDRWPVVAAAGEAGTRMLDYGPVVGGRQFPLFWVEPLAADAPVPPGLRRLPEPGTIVLSPALNEALGPDVVGRFGLESASVDGRPELIDPTGLAGPDEFIAYARPPSGRTLEPAPRSVEVSAFGATRPMTPLGLGYGPDSPASVLLGGLALLSVPALYLVWVSVGSGAHSRDARLATLFEIGASRGTRRAIVFLEAVIQSIVGVVLGAGVWYGVLTRLPGIPVAGLPYFRGDLDVALPWIVGVATIALVVIGLLAVVQSSTGRVGARASGRRRIPRRLATVMRVGALCLVVVLVALAQTRSYPESAQYWQLAVIIAVCTQPLTLPLYIDLLGRWVRRRDNATTWLAGRRMVHSPARLARPAFALAGLVLVGVIGISIAAVRSAASTASAASDPAVISLNWVDATVGDVGSLRRALPGAAVLSLVELPDGRAQLSVPSCADVLALLSESSCDGAIPDSIGERLNAQMARMIGFAPTVTVDPSVEVDGHAPVDDVIIMGSAAESGEELYVRVLPIANRVLGVTNLSGGRFLQFTEDARRAGAAAAFAAAIVFLSALVLLGDRSILLASENEALDVLGLAPKEQRRITFLEIALPALASIAAGGTVGTLFALTGQDLDTKPETLFLWIPIVSVIAVVVLLALSVAFCVARIQPSEPVRRALSRRSPTAPTQS